MRRVVTSLFLFLLAVLLVPTESPALKLTFIRPLWDVGLSNHSPQLANWGSECDTCRILWSPTKVTLANFDGTARACLVNGVRRRMKFVYSTQKSRFSQATTIVIELITTTGELKTLVSGTILSTPL